MAMVKLYYSLRQLATTGLGYISSLILKPSGQSFVKIRSQVGGGSLRSENKLIGHDFF